MDHRDLDHRDWWDYKAHMGHRDQPQGPHGATKATRTTGTTGTTGTSKAAWTTAFTWGRQSAGIKGTASGAAGTTWSHRGRKADED